MDDKDDLVVDITTSATYLVGYDDGFAAGLAAATQQLSLFAAKYPAQTTAGKRSLDEPVFILNLTKRTNNILRRVEVDKVGELYDYEDGKPKSFEGVRNFGRATFNEINAALMGRGYPPLKIAAYY